MIKTFLILLGIEDFVSLTGLSIIQNSHTSLDVSNLSELKFLRTDGNPNLESINVTGLTKLEFLRFNSTNVTNIDISTNFALKELWAFQIPGMTQMIDVSNNTELWRVLVQKNSIVGKIDLSNLTKLTWLSCQENEIDQLNLKNGNNTNITTFQAHDNPSLVCISVDDPVAANAGSGSYGSWTIDAGAIYNDDCTQPVITLDGENPQIIELGVGYTELGANTDDGSTVVIDATAFMDVVGNYTITYNATNAIGNSAVEVTRIVNVVDTTNPMAICQNINVFLSPSGSKSITANQIDNGSSDLSGIASLVVNQSNFTIDDVGDNTVTLTVTDNNGNSSNCMATVRVEDNIAPFTSCKDITVQLDATGNVSITASQVDGGTTDASGIASLSIDITDFDYTDIGDNTVILTATDTNGNSDTCTATVTVEDTIAPVITLVGDNPQFIELGAGYTELGATTDDKTIVVIDTTDFIDAIGSYMVTYNATDASGNVASEVTRIVNVVRVNQSTWDGSASSVWSEGTNWSGNIAPLVTKNAVIPNVGTTPNVVSNVQINDLTIEVSSSFDISETGSVTVDGGFSNDGTFKMTSIGANSSALIVKGSTSGEVTYERGGLLANKWSIVSAPVHGQSIKDFVENAANSIRINTSTTPNRYAMSYYDDSQISGSKWVYYDVDYLAANPTETFEKGRSYAISRGTDGVVTFTGTLEIADVTKPVAASEWNAVGNPYTAFLPINENSGMNFINDNSSKLDPVNVGVYVWDNAQSKYVGKSLVTGESSLAPGHGFFVKTTTGVTDITFSESERKTQPGTGGTFNRGGGKTSPSIQLLATLKGITVDTNIKYFDNATKGLDPGYDLGNYARLKFDVYTRLLNDEEGQDYTIQSLPTDDIETTIMPLGIKASSGDEVNFTVNTKDLPEGVEVFIEDKELSTFTKLNVDTNENYSVKITEKVDGIGRFYLHTKTNKLPVGALHIDEIEIYTIDKNTLRVDGFTTGNFKLELYNILGTSVLEKAVEVKGKNLVNLPNLQTGVYIVRINSDLGVKTKKIMIK